MSHDSCRCNHCGATMTFGEAIYHLPVCAHDRIDAQQKQIDALTEQVKKLEARLNAAPNGVRFS